ncbi:Alpha/Beta hydrolase protein [Pseudomassariella vexata]|uniref:Alpha/Beta hydrolase protein n=1 Tax=Pseudomassariella vexata TaxID=1141098 RepID=A0A1Y2E6W4_9PEZI|nr:Alpha/Beta hydrolase protein [Pseudomassariella vexata]ORY66605.1 Alpha/Beta hydrolase protein [Pseudomassariella vexata]
MGIPRCQEYRTYNVFVLDGNALGMTATEAWRRRLPVEPTQPDSIVVSIGYPITDSVYSPQRGIDFQPVTPGEDPPAEPGVREGADDFIHFIEGTLRPFIHSEFPQVNFGRDALYGHSFGGLFVIYALLRRPDLFDTFLSSSPALFWNDGYLLNHTYWLDEAKLPENVTKPAFRLAYGDLEQYPVKRRTETNEQYQSRLDLYATFSMTDNCHALYESLKGSNKSRDVVLKEYVGSDHASVAAVALTDGIDYFVDW